MFELLFALLSAAIFGSRHTRLNNSSSEVSSDEVESDAVAHDADLQYTVKNLNENYFIKINFSPETSDEIIETFVDSARELAKFIQNPPENLIKHEDAHTHIFVAPSLNLDSSALTTVEAWTEDGAIPQISVINFDPKFSDVNSDTYDLSSLFTHEILHAMGFGVSWDNFGLIEINENGDLFYTGLIENDYALDGGIPLSEDGKHWDEETFGKDVGTPIVDYGSLLSSLTIDSLSDLGFEIVPVEDFGEEPIENEDLEDMDYI